MISESEILMVRQALEMAQAKGAQDVRATLSKSREDMVATLNGEVDKVTRCEDSSLSIVLFVDGRFGSFSTNKLDAEALDSFLTKAVGIVRMLAQDPCRKLPERDRICTDALDGKEDCIFDASCSSLTAEQRRQVALDACIFGKAPDTTRYKVISEEGEFSSSEYDLYLADTQGLSCRHSETSFDYGVEVTIEDAEGDKYSGWWWHSSPFLKDLEYKDCGMTAVKKAAEQIGAQAVGNGKYDMVISRDVASKVVSPILNALGGYAIQQNNSFLLDSLGQQRFPEGLTIMDLPRIKGQTGSKYFDSEGVATEECPIIEKGCIRRYFINTYMSGKLGMEPTIEEATRPKVLPWPKPGLGLEDILGMCGDGIYVTDFNGGNCNMATGDFSYGIEGRVIRGGKLAEPVSGMLVTGNFLSLWGNLIAAGDDARTCMSKLIPTLAFSNVDFNG